MVYNKCAEYSKSDDFNKALVLQMVVLLLHMTGGSLETTK